MYHRDILRWWSVTSPTETYTRSDRCPLLNEGWMLISTLSFFKYNATGRLDDTKSWCFAISKQRFKKFKNKCPLTTNSAVEHN